MLRPKLRLTIERDHVEDPLPDAWVFHSFHASHPMYASRREYLTPTGRIQLWLKKELAQNKAFWCDYTSGASFPSWGLYQRVDTDNVTRTSGLLLFQETRPKHWMDPRERQEAAFEIVKRLTYWYNDACYRFEVHELTKCDCCEQNVLGEQVSAEGGLFGPLALFAAARKCLADWPQHRVEVAGSLRDLAMYHDIRPPLRGVADETISKLLP